MKQTMYLIVWRAIQWDTDWKEVYDRSIDHKCRTDERTRRLIGREKVIGRLAGQMLTVIYVLLKQDQEILSRLAPGATPPEPFLYDTAIHRRRRQEGYQPAKAHNRARREIQFPVS